MNLILCDKIRVVKVLRLSHTQVKPKKLLSVNNPCAITVSVMVRTSQLDKKLTNINLQPIKTIRLRLNLKN